MALVRDPTLPDPQALPDPSSVEFTIHDLQENSSMRADPPSEIDTISLESAFPKLLFCQSQHSMKLTGSLMIGEGFGQNFLKFPKKLSTNGGNCRSKK